MKHDFKGKTAVVTGAATGIGFGVASVLLDFGANVVLNDVNEDDLKVALVKLRNSKGKSAGIAGDMSSLDDIGSLVAFTIETFGQVDYLVANAGITRFKPFLESTEEDFTKVVDLNLKGTYFLTQEVSKHFIKEKIRGKVVLMSSNISRRAYPGLSVYSMSKAGLNMLVRSLAFELSEHHININAVAPGATVTERTLEEGYDYRKVWSELLPTGQPVEIEDIGNVVSFLLSEEALQMNGQVLVVDGGWSGISRHPDV